MPKHVSVYSAASDSLFIIFPLLYIEKADGTDIWPGTDLPNETTLL